jgi:hypothetical protein
MSPRPRARKVPSKKAIDRAVASSTALETGQRIKDIEAELNKPTHRFHKLTLAR